MIGAVRDCQVVSDLQSKLCIALRTDCTTCEADGFAFSQIYGVEDAKVFDSEGGGCYTVLCDVVDAYRPLELVVRPSRSIGAGARANRRELNAAADGETVCRAVVGERVGGVNLSPTNGFCADAVVSGLTEGARGLSCTDRIRSAVHQPIIGVVSVGEFEDGFVFNQGTCIDNGCVQRDGIIFACIGRGRQRLNLNAERAVGVACAFEGEVGGIERNAVIKSELEVSLTVVGETSEGVFNDTCNRRALALVGVAAVVVLSEGRFKAVVLCCRLVGTFNQPILCTDCIVTIAQNADGLTCRRANTESSVTKEVERLRVGIAYLIEERTCHGAECQRAFKREVFGLLLEGYRAHARVVHDETVFVCAREGVKVGGVAFANCTNCIEGRRGAHCHGVQTFAENQTVLNRAAVESAEDELLAAAEAVESSIARAAEEAARDGDCLIGVADLEVAVGADAGCAERNGNGAGDFDCVDRLVEGVGVFACAHVAEAVCARTSVGVAVIAIARHQSSCLVDVVSREGDKSRIFANLQVVVNHLRSVESKALSCGVQTAEVEDASVGDGDDFGVVLFGEGNARCQCGTEGFA